MADMQARPWAPQEEIEERRTFVMKQRNRGLTYAEIAELWAKKPGVKVVSLVCIAEDYHIIMKRRAAELNAETDAIRVGQLDTLNLAKRKLLDHMIDREGPPSIEAIDTLIKLEARIARLMGTDAATKSEMTVNRKLELTPQQIRDRMAELQGRIRERLGEPGTVVEGQVVPQRAELPEPRQVTPQIIAGTADDEPVLGEPHT